MKKLTIKGIGVLLITSHIAIPFSSAQPSPEIDVDMNQWTSNIKKMVSSPSPDSSILQMAMGTASESIKEEISDWINGKGRVGLNIIANEKGSLKISEAMLLYPFYDSEQLIIFTQGSFHLSDERNQGNFGIGTRYLQNSWIIGTNAFYDHDFSLEHSRIGFGVEYTRDFMRISANSYAHLSGWRDDKRLTGYQSRPANGWDIRSEAWLPVHLQLGGKLNFEQYYGNEVALVSYNDRQKNPYAITAGVNYTPVPLITAGVDVKRGKSGANETQFGLSLNYTMGESWSKQIAQGAVAAQRSLAGSRYEFVNRNNNIVLDYRKQEVITLGFPAEVRGTELTDVTLTPVIRSQHSVSTLELDTAELTNAGGHVVSASPSAVVIRLPTYQHQGIRLTGVAVDRQGNRSNMAETMIYMTEGAHSLTLEADKIEAVSDGSDSVALTIHVDNAGGAAIAGTEITLQADAGVLSSTAGKTNANGNYTVTLSSEQSGEVHVTATEGNHTVTHPGVRFITVTNGSLSLNKTTAMANGEDAVQVALTLKDSTGKALADREVSWKASMGTLSATSNKTDADGSVSVLLTSTSAGNTSVTATSGNDSWASDNIVFEQGKGTYGISVDKTLATSNGRDKITFTVTASKADGSTMEGETVSWSTDAGTLSDAMTTVDVNGKTSVHLSSSAPGAAHVSANIADEVLSATEVKFEKGVLSLVLSVSQTSFYATGSSGPRYTLMALNPDGTPAAGESVVWSTDLGTLDIKSSVTDANGKAEAYVYSKTAGMAHTTAAIENQKVNADEVTFLEYLDIELRGDTTEAKADGKPVKFTLTVKDIDKQPVAGRDVKWTTTVGQLSDTTVQTDSNGRSEVTLSSTVAGAGNISADVNGSPMSMPITFIEDTSVSITADKTQFTSSGYDWVTYTVIVRNTDGTPAAGETVNWATNVGTLAQDSTVTDSNGKATVRLTSTDVGIARVTATAKNKTQEAPEVTIVQYIITFLTSESEGVADGKTPVILTFTAQNSDRSPMPGAEIKWTSTGGTLSSSNTVTGENGNASITITSSAEGSIRVTGDLDSNSQTATINFKAAPAVSNLTVTAEAVDKDGGNVNGKSFGSKSPKYLWAGAKIRLYAADATGSVTWASSSSAVSINGDVISIESNPNSVTITGTDESGVTGTYTINPSTWISYISSSSAFIGTAGYIGTSAYGTCEAIGSVVMSRNLLSALYNEWGNFLIYDGWIRGYYLTSTPYTGYTDPQQGNYKVWPETGTWSKNTGMQHFACV